MEFSLPEFPAQPAAQAAFIAAIVSLLLGLILAMIPSSVGRLLGLGERPGRAGAIAELRSGGGFILGLSLATLLFDQPVLYVALGAAFATAALGRLVSMLMERAASLPNVALLMVQVLIAAALLNSNLFDVFSTDTTVAFPEEFNAQLVFAVYGLTAAVGLAALLAPRAIEAVAGLQPMTAGGTSLIRSGGGFAIGSALVGLAAANPMMELGFGAALAFAVAFRIVGLVINRGNFLYAAAAIVVEAAAATLVLSYVIGMM